VVEELLSRGVQTAAIVGYIQSKGMFQTLPKPQNVVISE
jgi:hypothetical protein